MKLNQPKSIIASLFLLSSASLSLQACTPSTEPTLTQSKHNAMSAIPKRAEGIWIDVRTAEEYQQGHLSETLNIPHDGIAKEIMRVAPNKDQPIHLYCRSGSRANLALQELKKLGYHNVQNHGGYNDLIQQGFK